MRLESDVKVTLAGTFSECVGTFVAYVDSKSRILSCFLSLFDSYEAYNPLKGDAEELVSAVEECTRYWKCGIGRFSGV